MGLRAGNCGCCAVFAAGLRVKGLLRCCSGHFLPRGVGWANLFSEFLKNWGGENAENNHKFVYSVDLTPTLPLKVYVVPCVYVCVCVCMCVCVCL